MHNVEDFLLTQTILDRAVSPDSAREQVKALIEWVRQLGVLQIESSYSSNDFQYEFRLVPTPPASK
jgi:hypothetical protein